MRRTVLLLLTIALASLLSACGSAGIKINEPKSSVNYHGAQLFAERCGGCHTLGAAGTQGSGTAFDKEKTDGPNLNYRKETVASTLYAIRNGGFSGQIMPQNVVVGPNAQAVARFVSKYAGTKGKKPNAPSGNPPAGF